MSKKSVRQELVEQVIIDHQVDMSGTAMGGGWDLWQASCRSCGIVPRDEWPAAHIARILDQHKLIVRNPTTI